MQKPQAIDVERSLSVPSGVMRGNAVCIVGNGATVFDRHRGEMIDDHDVVVRINAGAPEEAQYRVLGARTTVLAVATERCLNESLRHMGAVPAHVWWFKRTRLGFRELQRVQSGRASGALWLWPEAWETACAEYVGAPPSTGMRLAWGVVELWGAQMATLVGVDCWRSGPSWWYSRRRMAVLTAANPHDPAREREALERLGYETREDGVWRWRA